MQMGDKKISRANLALRSGLGRTQLGAKLDGLATSTLDDINAIARAYWPAMAVGAD
jgi:hypothetical protein